MPFSRKGVANGLDVQRRASRAEASARAAWRLYMLAGLIPSIMQATHTPAASRTTASKGTSAALAVR